MEIKLIRPTEAYADQVMAFKEEMLLNGDSLDGCAALEEVSSFSEWMDFERRLKEKYGDIYVPSEIFLGVRESDDRLVGIMDFRHPLCQFLYDFGGSIGCSVRPSERKKGYAGEMLSLLKPICREYGETSILACCSKDNEGSRRTILKNGGVLENEVLDSVGLCNGGLIQRYWIPV